MAHARPLAFAVVAAAALVAPTAAAQEAPPELPPLALHELHAHRLELDAVGAASLVPSRFVHVGGGGDLAYYMTEYLALGVAGRVWDPVGGTPPTRPSSSPPASQKAWDSSVDLTIVPYSTGRGPTLTFLPFDFHLRLGVGAISEHPTAVIDPRRTFDDRVKVEFVSTAGARLFVTPSVALGAEVRDAVYAADTENRAPSKLHDQASWYGPTSLTNDLQVSLGVSLWLPYF